MTKIVVVEANNPYRDDLTTVTITGRRTVDASRVMGVLAYTLSTPSEWDAAMPNVQLIVELEA